MSRNVFADLYQFVVGKPIAPALQGRVEQLDNQRKAGLIGPAVLSMMVLTLSGFLPAVRPRVVPAMIAWLTAILLVFAISLALNRSGRTSAAAVVYVAGIVGFYMGALFATPISSDGTLSYQNFGAGNLYYILASVLPIFASALLLSPGGALLVNLIVVAADETAIFLLPHDAGFAQFAAQVGGPIFFSLSVTLGQIVLYIFGVVAARTIRDALVASVHATDLELTNRVIAERQQRLEADIQHLQAVHARVANGENVYAALDPGSDLILVATSLNLMISRLARLNREEHVLRQIEQSLELAVQQANSISGGDLTLRPAATGTIVDGVLAALAQMQAQLANWINEMRGAVTEQVVALQQLRAILIAALQEMQQAVERGNVADAAISELALQRLRAAIEDVAQVAKAMETREGRLAGSLARIHT